MKIMNASISGMCSAAISFSLILSASAQKVDYSPSGVTNVPSSEYSLSRGNTTRRPKNYDYYYYNNKYNPTTVLVPAAVTPTPFVHRVLGAVKPYSSLEYSDLILKTMNEDRARDGLPLIGVEPPPTTTTMVAQSEIQADIAAAPAAKVEPATEPPAASSSRPMLESATVVDVGDRGVLVTRDSGELRLRGVAFASGKSKDDSRRKFAEDSMDALRALVVGKTIYYVVEEPSKGFDGRTMAIVHLSDGTMLNRLVLESGMAIVNPGDFPDEIVGDDLITAQANAVKNGRGIWSIWETATR